MVLVPAQASPNWVQRLRPTPPTWCMGEGQQELRQHSSCARGRPAVTPRAGCVALSSATSPPTPRDRSLVCTGDSACASVPHQREAEGARTSPEQAHSTPARQMPRSPDGCSQQTLKNQQPAEHGPVSPPLLHTSGTPCGQKEVKLCNMVALASQYVWDFKSRLSNGRERGKKDPSLEV